MKEKYIQWDDPKDWKIGKTGEDEASFKSGFFFGALTVCAVVLIISLV